MSTKRLSVGNHEIEENNEFIVLNNFQVNEIAEKITNDLKTVNLDTRQKVNYIKERILKILTFYKRETVDDSCSTISDVDIEEMRNQTRMGIRKNVTTLAEKATIDFNVIHLYDRALTKEAEHNIKEKILQDKLFGLKDKIIGEAHKINNCQETLNSAIKSVVQERLGSDNAAKFSADFEKSEAQTKEQVEKTKHNIQSSMSAFLMNPLGKKTEAEIESEKQLFEDFTKFKSKIKNDLQSKKEVLDQTVDDINSKMKNIMPSKHTDDEK